MRDILYFSSKNFIYLIFLNLNSIYLKIIFLTIYIVIYLNLILMVN